MTRIRSGGIGSAERWTGIVKGNRAAAIQIPGPVDFAGLAPGRLEAQPVLLGTLASLQVLDRYARAWTPCSCCATAFMAGVKSARKRS